MILVARKAPDFTASAVLGDGKIVKDFNLRNFIKDKISVLFFWPMDFTFVCPSEIIAFNKRYEHFQKLNTKIVGVSIDSEFVHCAWRRLPIDKGGIGTIKYPMISDIKREIIKLYGLEHPEIGVALRGSFLIDKKGIVRHQIVNDLPLGRNVDEIIRVINALQFIENEDKVCPAQWENGKDGIEPSYEGISRYLSHNLDKL